MTPQTSRAMQVADPGASLALIQVETPDPGPGQVRITVEACGICHSDAMITVEACGICHSDAMITAGFLPGTTFPVTTGHEVAARIESLGAGVAGWRVGQRVAVGWFGGSDGYCDACREGDAINCSQLQIPGVAYPGGYADAIVVPSIALARIPDELTAAEAAPLACAGVTMFNALRRSAARAGDVVAILGLGGLGHLGVQFAAAMGFVTVALPAGRRRPPWPRSSGPATTSTAPARMWPIGSRSSAEPRWCWPP
jgi:D-arabinose 1-dehydrogenase-like Zn-dependent alcohol dehydrogenase